MRRGNRFYNEAFTTTNSAPSGATDGVECRLLPRAGDKLNADEWTVVAVFNGAAVICTIVPYEYIGGAWVGGASQELKKTPDANGGAILDLPCHGVATRLDFHVSTLAADGVTISVYHNEHEEN